MKKFYNQQSAPELINEFTGDELLQYYTYKFIKNKHFMEIIYPDLVRFGEKCAKIYPNYAQEAERYKPILEKYDAYGKYLLFLSILKENNL